MPTKAKNAGGATSESSEAEKVKYMIQNMAKTVAEKSEWFIVSMQWINKWQKHVGFDESEAEKGPNPGKIDNKDIIVARHQTDKGVFSTCLLEQG
jgi:hypothetical protein